MLPPPITMQTRSRAASRLHLSRTMRAIVPADARHRRPSALRRELEQDALVHRHARHLVRLRSGRSLRPGACGSAALAAAACAATRPRSRPAFRQTLADHVERERRQRRSAGLEHLLDRLLVVLHRTVARTGWSFRYSSAPSRRWRRHDPATALACLSAALCRRPRPPSSSRPTAPSRSGRLARRPPTARPVYAATCIA